jgi:anti-sigma-K factor RskA
MTEQGHDELKQLLAAYALGAVSAEEAERVRAHLSACDDCRVEANALAETAASLSLAVEPEPLPEGFVERVMARVAVPDSPQPEPQAAAGFAAVPDAARARRPTRARPRLVHVLAYAALAIGIVVLAVNLWTLQRESQRERRLLYAIVRYEGMWLRGEGDAAGRMVGTKDGGLFVASGLPRPPSGHTYQLWLIDAAGPRSGGTFEASNGVSVVRTDESLEDVQGVAVTVEPVGGSRSPTSDPVISSV